MKRLKRNGGVEAEARRAIRRLVAYRLLGDVAAIPRSFAFTAAQVFASFEKTVFVMELDAARRYRAIANVDLALAAGEPSRYSGLAPFAAAGRDAMFHPDPREEE